MTERDYDVVVVGGGGAGLAAALAARGSGASVLILEAGERAGGSSAMSGGVVYAAGTSVQRAAGISDSADAMYEYYMTLNQWNLEPYLVRRLADESAEVVEWLIELGVEFRPERLYCAGVESVPRGHMTEGAGFALFQRLEQTAAAQGVEMVLRTRVTGLVRDDERRVIGARAGDTQVRAGAVVMACGGIGGNARIVARVLSVGKHAR